MQISEKKSPQNGTSKNDQNDVAWWQPSLVLFTRLSAWIGLPVIAALFVGKSLDEKYDTEPWLFLLSVGIAFALSSVGIVKEAKGAMKIISPETEEKKPEEGNKKIEQDQKIK